jgi:hypothetical protein
MAQGGMIVVVLDGVRKIIEGIMASKNPVKLIEKILEVIEDWPKR